MLHDSADQSCARPENIVSGFRRIASEHGGDPAVVDGKSELSYAELDRLSDSLAARLTDEGVGIESVVALCLDRGAAVPIAILGVLKAGAAYLPVDTRSPQDRVRAIAADSAVRTVVAGTPEQAELSRELLGKDIKILTLNHQDKREKQDHPFRGDQVVSSGQLAYVMYTSGSTGIPKGVGVTHANVLGLSRDTLINKAFDGPDGVPDRVLMHSPLAFDASTYEVLATLLRGACCVVAPPDDMDGEILRRLITDRGVTRAAMTPALFAAFADEDPRIFSGLRQLILGGDAPSPTAVSRVLEAVEKLEIINGYGPTETTTYAARHAINRGDDGRIPLGKPMDGFRLCVEDPRSEDGGQLARGELFLSGPGVSRGYLGRPALTAECFLPDPHGAPGSRRYRTGDICRRREDGLLEFVGRADRQVKIRGFRVELGEIEAALSQHPDVLTGVVTTREGLPGASMIVGYAVPAADRTATSAALLDWLRTRLPDYMVPGALVILNALPLTANGKVDVRALPAPALHTGPTLSATGPEHVLARLFAEVLGLPEVGVQANFLDLGGNSLLAVRLIGQLRSRYGIDLRVKDLLRRPTLTAVLDGLSPEERGRLTDPSGNDGKPALIPVSTSPKEPVPLSFAQQRLWFLDQLWPGRPDYNVPLAVRLRGPLSRTALSSAVTSLLERHDILRTRYVERDDQPWQIVEPVPDAAPLTFADCRTGDPDAALHAADEQIRRLWEKPFDLTSAAPVRVLLAAVGEDEHILCLVIHHIATDGWSGDILLSDLAALYARETGARTAGPGNELAVRYADYGQWQRDRFGGQDLREELDYWRAELHGATPTALPADRPRPSVRSGRGAQVDFTVANPLRDELMALSRSSGTTLFMTLLAAFQVLVAKLSDQRDVSIGTPIAGRTRPELESIVGFFVNTLVIRGDVAPECSFQDLLGRTRDKAAAAYTHGEFPFEKLVEELHPERDLGRNPLFQLMFAMSDAETATERNNQWPVVESSAHPVPFRAAKFDFEIAMAERSGELVGHAYYASDLFDESTVRLLLRRYVALLQRLVGDPRRRLGDIGVLAEDELKQITASNATDQAFNNDRPLHHLVAAQAGRTPRATAVQHGDRRLSYGELECLSNQLAHLLLARGVRPGTPVGVWFHRDLYVPVALLGVMKAGGAFIPLDPDLPAARAGQILAEAGASVCVVGETPCGVLPGDDIAAIPLIPAELGELPTAQPPVAVYGDDLASIYYTSGSTGKPKGVANTHRGWANRMWWMHHQHGLEPGGGVLHKTVLSFDDSAVELFWPLLVGGRIVMLDPGLHRDPRAILRAAMEYRVAVVQFVPSMLGLFLDEITPGVLPRLSELRHVISSGESLRPELVNRFHQLLGPTECSLHNQWGPTEASIDATFHTCSPADAKTDSVPIGLPLANYQVHILDRALVPVPIGVEGELYVGGVGLARCYWNDPVKTAEAFVPNLFVKGERLYRTGDRAVRTIGGSLVFRGRRDDQVKIRGNRVELGEVEKVLATSPLVSEAAAAVWEPAPGDRRLVTYAVLDGGAAVEPEQLRTFLADRLPTYMVPSRVITLDALPTSASGKLDRKSLPVPEPDDAPLGATGRPPQTESELLVAQVWSQFLDATDADANFFDCGGHSLLATRIVSRLRRALDMELPLVVLFEHPTIAGLAAAIERELMSDLEDV